LATPGVSDLSNGRHVERHLLIPESGTIR